MTIACTRCGAQQEGDIILPPIAFTFKHNSGCGHGVGPLAVLPGSVKPKKKEEKPFGESFTEKFVDKKEDVIVETKEEKPKKSKIEKIKVFGKKEKSDG